MTDKRRRTKEDDIVGPDTSHHKSLLFPVPHLITHSLFFLFTHSSQQQHIHLSPLTIRNIMRLSHSTCIGSLQVVTSLFHASLLASLLFGSNQLLPGTDAASADVEQHHQHHQSQQHDNQQQSRRQPHQQPVIHKQMNEHDLRKVFQVQSHDEVPEYDIVHLDVINRRPSDVDGGSSTNINEEGQEDYLSKRSNNNQRRDFNDRTGSGSTSTSNSNDDTLKYVYLNAFGNGMHLNLKRNDELHHKLKSLKLITAESRSTATSSKWAPPSHVNVEGVRYSESSIQGEGEDSVGVPYHDDHHVAAVIVSTGPDGQATLVSCTFLPSIPQLLLSFHSSSCFEFFEPSYEWIE